MLVFSKSLSDIDTPKSFRSKTHVVLAALRRSPNEFASYLNKLFKAGDHMGVAIAGLTADARTLVKHIRTEALEHEFTYSSNIQAGRLASELADMLQRCTQSYVRRPYGVGLLIAAWDATGSHLIEISPRFQICIYIYVIYDMI